MKRGTLGAPLVLAISFGAAACASNEPPPAATPRAAEAPPPAASALPAPSTPPPAQAGPIAPANVSISLGNAGVVVNGSRLEGPTVADVKRLFGEPDRVEDKANRIHVFDRYGILAYEPYNGFVEEIQIYFVPESYSFIPKAMFRGHIDFAGQVVDKTTPVPSLRGVEQNDVTGWWTYKRGALSLIITASEDSVRREIGHLSVSFPKRAVSDPSSGPREASLSRNAR